MALSMQMTPGDDNLAVWVIRLKSEGTNLITNGTFDDATGWTQTGDWSITGGEATYTFSANASGDLTITTAAVSAVAYVLEYEVTTVAQDGFTLSLEGTGSFVSTVEVFLPITLGQHRVIISGKASSTVFRLKARGFAGGDVLKIDNVKFRKLEETTYIATQDLSLTNTWDGQALNFNDRVSDIDSFVDTGSSGTIGGVSAYVFTISRYSDNTRFDGFFEEFYPAFDGGNLSSMECEVGIVWNTASTDTEITWLMPGRIVDYSYTPRKMILTVLQSTEIDSRPLPYYKIQNVFDNGVSYFPNAPEDNYGTIIPIIYGDKSLGNFVTGVFNYAPAYMTDKELNQFVLASHKLFGMGVGGAGVTPAIFKRIDSLGAYMALWSNSDLVSNTDIRALYDLTNTNDEVYGEVDIHLKGQSSYSEVTGIGNVIDNITSNYKEIDSPNGVDGLAVKMGAMGTTSEMGYMGVSAGDVELRALIASNDGGNRDWTLNYNNLTISTPPNLGAMDSGTHITGTSPAVKVFAFGNDTTNKASTVLPWTIEELGSLDYYVQNDDVDGGDLIRVYYLYLHLEDIIVSGVVNKLNLQYLSNISSIAEFEESRIERIDDIAKRRILHKKSGVDSKTDIQAVWSIVEGREYGRWIDFATSAGGTRDAANGTATDPGFAEGDLIETASYIIESIFRDEIFVERDLQITSTVDTTHFVCSGVISREDDYYNNAEYYNATTKVKRYVTDYVGSTNIFTINAADGAMAADDNIYLTNVQGDNRIDTFSFDTVGNETNGSREVGDGWEYARAIITEETLEGLISSLCFESHCQIFETADEDAGYSKVKIVALDTASSGDTWTKPAFDESGKEMVQTSLTPLSSIYTSFEMFYSYQDGTGAYNKSILVDKNGFGGTGTLVIADQLLCGKAEATYRVTQSFVYNANWIADDTCAELMLHKKIEWFTKQRLIVGWTTGLSDGAIDYIKFERGDQVKLNYSQSIPTGLNNSSFFMITNKRIITVQGSPLIQWKLIEMG